MHYIRYIAFITCITLSTFTTFITFIQYIHYIHYIQYMHYINYIHYITFITCSPPKPPTFSVPTPAQLSQGETTVVRLSRTAHFLLPTVIEQQAERLRTARQAAAQGMLSSTRSPFWRTPKPSITKAKSTSCCLCPQNGPPTVDSPLYHSKLGHVVNRPFKALCTMLLPSTIPTSLAFTYPIDHLAGSLNDSNERSALKGGRRKQCPEDWREESLLEARDVERRACWRPSSLQEEFKSVTPLAQAVLVQVSGSGIPQTWLVHERH